MTNKNTIRLAENITIREQAKKLVSILERDGIKQLSIRQHSHDELVIERTDIPYFEIPNNEEETLQDEQRERMLQIISLSFKEDNKWRFTDGAEPFNAPIEDMDFLNKISNDEISFAKNDYLVCIVRERQIKTTKGLRLERAILQVIEHKSASQQLKLI